MTPGWSLEPTGNGGPRGMVATHRTRLTDLSAGRALRLTMPRVFSGSGRVVPWTRGHGPAFAGTRDRERAVARAARARISGDDRGDRALGVLDPRGAVRGGPRVSQPRSRDRSGRGQRAARGHRRAEIGRASWR